MELQLNVSDLAEIQRVVKDYSIDGTLKIIRHGESGIGYCLDISYENTVKGRMVTTRIEVVGPQDW